MKKIILLLILIAFTGLQSIAQKIYSRLHM